jgi:beta-lactamase regulating signal transducer with metallopeptidase domain
MSFIPDMTLVFDSLGWAVLHSIWQGALAAFVVWMFRIFTSDKSADLRYMLGFTTMAALMGAFMITFLYYFNAGSSTGETSITLLGLRNLDLAAATANGTTSPLALLLNSTNLIGTVWAVCFAILGARYLAAFKLTHKLRATGLSDLSGSWKHKFDRLARNCGVNPRTRAYVSEHVSSPITFGFFKPIVLVPTWFFTGMNSEQCEVVLLHELAHIRRHDYIANILQIMIKTVFFYHPAVQYISKTVDADREDACDDIAVNMTRDPENLARALGAIRIRAASGGGVFALSADGRDAPLMHRLKRLVGTPIRKNQTGAVRGFASTSMLAISCALVMVLGATQSQAHPQTEVDAEVEARAHELANEWMSEDKAELAGAPENKWKSKSYNYGTFSKDNKSYKVKTDINGKTWIKMDGNWHDIKNHPEWNIVPPKPPAAPVITMPRVDVIAPVPPVATTFRWNSTEDQQVMSDLARDMASDQQELAEELAEAQQEIAEQMAELQTEHAQELAEAQKELAAHLKKIKKWDSNDQEHLIEDKKEFEREMEDLQRELAEAQVELQRELAEGQKEYKREMAELQREVAREQREIAHEQREIQQELQREQRDVQRETRNAEREMQRAEVERVKADKKAKQYEKMREQLVPVLIADGYMNSEKSKVKIKLTSEDIFINGEKLANDQEGKYCDIISKYVDRKGDVKLIVFKPGYMHVEAKGKNGHSSYTFNDDH